jgi:drug/metabolite transporter (DMT)-like permease
METINVERKKEYKHTNFSVSGLCNSAGIIACVCMIIYFFIMSAFKLEEILALRAVNFIFLLGGIILALYTYSKIIKDKIDYFTGLKMGIWVTFMAVIPFALFMAIYLMYDDYLMDIIKQSTRMGEYVNPFTIFGAICAEGISSGAIIAFIIMQFFKKEVNN